MKRIVCILLLAVFGMLPASRGTELSVQAAPAWQSVSGDTPPAVANGQATYQGRFPGRMQLSINVGLAVRNSAQLDALIVAASTPGSQRYGQYLTHAEYMAQFAPTRVEVQAATNWLHSQGLTVSGVSPDSLLIHVRANAEDVARAFGVSLNEYRFGNRSFYANDRNPVTPAGLNVHFISGLTNYDVFRPQVTCTPSPGSSCGYDGTDFRKAYDVVGDGKSQTIGFTLWGESLPQSDYTGYATATGTTPLTIGQAGDNGLDWVPVDGTTSESDTDLEVALDTQTAHGVAPGVHETYWLGKDNSNSTLEDVLSAAANSSISIISNSWGGGCSVDGNMETALQLGAATGKTFFFSSGDSPASSGCSYPAESQYVVSVGGSALTQSGASFAESAVHDASGCTNSEPRPSWQTGIPTTYTWPSTVCTGRAVPDVAAASGYCTDNTNCGPGSYLYYHGAGQCCIGGTSMSAPIWAAGSIVWNNNNSAQARPGIGFAAPLIYALANNSTDYPLDFHDITTGGNGFNAGLGWDEVTGWGSPDFNKLSNNIADLVYQGPTSATYNDTVTLSATLTDHGTTNGLSGRTVYFAASGESCHNTTTSSGYVSCTVTFNNPSTDKPGLYSVIAAFGGDAGYKAVSTTLNFSLNPVATALDTTPGPDINLGSGELSDSAHLTGGLSPAGTITFYLFAPGVLPNGTKSNALYTNTVPVSGAGSYHTSAGYSPLLGGEYEWLAVYSGDTYNAGSSEAFGNEPENAIPTLTISLSVPPPYTAYTQTHIFNNGVLLGVTKIGTPITVATFHAGTGFVNFSLTADPVLLATLGTNTDIFTGFVPPVSSTLSINSTTAATYTSIETILAAQRVSGFVGTASQKLQTYTLLSHEWASVESAIRQPNLTVSNRLAPVTTFACSVAASLSGGKITTGLATALQTNDTAVYDALGGVGAPTC